MSELMEKIVRSTIMAIVFIVGIALVIGGHQNVGAPGLCVMLLGLALLAGLLWFYNRKYR